MHNSVYGRKPHCTLIWIKKKKKKPSAWRGVGREEWAGRIAKTARQENVGWGGMRWGLDWQAKSGKSGITVEEVWRFFGFSVVLASILTPAAARSLAGIVSLSLRCQTAEDDSGVPWKLGEWEIDRVSSGSLANLSLTPLSARASPQGSSLLWRDHREWCALVFGHSWRSFGPVFFLFPFFIWPFSFWFPVGQQEKGRKQWGLKAAERSLVPNALSVSSRRPSSLHDLVHRPTDTVTIQLSGEGWGQGRGWVQTGIFGNF
jgi:hypothetical protein